ncbi:Nn.00g069420.m01.CDS01 [Neocucurbitaria sp. VM-36]
MSNCPTSDSGYQSNLPDTNPTTPESKDLRLDTIKGLNRYEKHVTKSLIEHFEDIVGRLKGPLLTELRKSRKQFRPIAIRLLVLGKDETSAKPWIVVFCPECVCAIVRKYFRTDLAKQLCQPSEPGLVDLEVAVEGHPPRLKATEEPPSVTVALGRSDGSNGRWRTTHIKVDGSNETRYATMGGYIVVVGQDGAPSIYGLTAGHALIQDSIDNKCQSEQSEENLHSPNNVLSSMAIEEEVGTQHMQEEAGFSVDNAYTRISDPEEVIIWLGSGRVAPASFSTKAYNRDWALIEGIEHFDGQSSGKVIERYFLDTRTEVAHPIDMVEVICQPPFNGSLSHLPSFTLLPFGYDFVRTWTISIADGERLPAGTSGSWVITESVESRTTIRHSSQIPYFQPPDSYKFKRNMLAFGQVIADDTLGDVYVVPLADILADIQEVLAARKARLPENRSEIKTLLNRSYESKNVESGGPNNAIPSTQESETYTDGQALSPSHTTHQITTYSRNNYQWVCCRCHGHNSVFLDIGCALCCNHWRCGTCKIYSGYNPPGHYYDDDSDDDDDYPLDESDEKRSEQQCGM